MEPWNANTKKNKAVNFIVHHRNRKLMNKHRDILLVLLGRHEVLVVVVMVIKAEFFF